MPRTSRRVVPTAIPSVSEWTSVTPVLWLIRVAVEAAPGTALGETQVARRR